MAGFSVEALKKGIKDKEANIGIFEDAIKKEREEIAEYRFMIEQIRKNEETARAIKEMESKPVEVVREEASE